LVPRKKLPDSDVSSELEGCYIQPRRSAPGDDLHNLQMIARPELALGELRWGNSFTVVLHHDTAGKELLREQEGFD